MNHELDQPRFSVAEAAKILAYLGRNMRGQLHNWTPRGVFRPVEHVSEKTKTGSRLSLVDLVACAVLDSWLSSGLRFIDLEGTVSFHRYPPRLTWAIFITPLATITFDLSELTPQQKLLVFPEGLQTTNTGYHFGEDRVLQRYLCALNLSAASLLQPQYVRVPSEDGHAVDLRFHAVRLVPRDYLMSGLRSALYPDEASAWEPPQPYIPTGTGHLGVMALDVGEIAAFIEKRLVEV
ncbi:MAG: hypothetical protein AB1646_21905 [Thermodesulfobacteriota bacterium]